MSYETDKVLMPTSSSNQRPAVTNSENSHGFVQLSDIVLSSYPECSKKQSIHADSGSDMEDDFFSVKGDFSRSFSNASSCHESISDRPPLLNISEGDSRMIEEDKKNLVDNHTKLIEFLQDENWSEEIASTHTSIPVQKLKPKQQTILNNLSPKKGTSSLSTRKELEISDKLGRRAKQNNAATATHNCCFPSLSPRRSYKEKKRESCGS